MRGKGSQFDESRAGSKGRRESFQRKETFQKLVSSVIRAHGRSSITFNECMRLLAQFELQFSSPGEFKRFSKIYTGQSRQLPTAFVLRRLRFHSCLIAGFQQRQYLLSKQFGQAYTVEDRAEETDHSLTSCMQQFSQAMTAKHGQESNWFRAIGRMTIAVAISPALFQEGITKVLSKGRHAGCAAVISEQFQEQPGGLISWSFFMKVLRNLPRKPRALESEKRRSRMSLPINRPTNMTFLSGTGLPPASTAWKGQLQGKESVLRQSPTICKSLTGCSHTYGQDRGRQVTIGHRQRTQSSADSIEITGFRTGSYWK